MDKIRNAAVDLLVHVEKNQAYSTLTLQQFFNRHSLEAKDRGLLTEIFYGTLQHQLTLDYYLQTVMKKPKKLDPWVQQLLRLSVYQLVYLDKVPDHAVIFEAVQIAKKRGNRGIANFVNGVLRAFQRQGVPDITTLLDPIQQVSIRYSMPIWLVELLADQYGWEKMEDICQSVQTPPHLSVRIQELSVSAQTMLEHLAKEGVTARVSDISDRSLVIEKGDIFHSTAFTKGWVTIQDESSALVAQVGRIQPSDKLLDTCAAPGGKTTQMASYLDAAAGGHVVALDLYPHKLKKIQENAQRLHVADRITLQALDAREVAAHFPQESFDVVFVDAPCSGLGLMRRKPEIRYTKQQADLLALQQLQMDILKAAARMVKPQGHLIYSTCTINRAENDAIVEQFLKEQSEFQIDSLKGVANAKGDTLTILPCDYQSDGFYIARLVKT